MGMTELTTHAFEFSPPFDFWWILAVLVIGVGLAVACDRAGWGLLAALTGVFAAAAISALAMTYAIYGSATDDQMLREDIETQLKISSPVFEGNTKWFAGKAEDGSYVRCGMLESGDGTVFMVTCG